MKITTFLFFIFFGVNTIYSQTVTLVEFEKWRETNFEEIEVKLSEKGWKKSNSEKLSNKYINSNYFINKGSINEKVITLGFTDNYEIINNTISYTSIKNESYDDIIKQIKLSGYKLFKSNKNEKVISDYYRSEKNTVIISVLKGGEIEFYTIYICTNEDYAKSHKE